MQFVDNSFSLQYRDAQGVVHRQQTVHRLQIGHKPRRSAVRRLLDRLSA